SDKASVFDEAIEYLKTLKMQVQERKRFAKYFPAVICDLSAHFNIARRIMKGGVLYETTADRASLLPCQSNSNLLIDNEGNLKLADFGLARIYSSDHKGNLTNRVISLCRPSELLLGATKYGPTIGK
ncbi:cyclin-dependent kinase C-1-like protein, partial [Tanacetum coccineum]